MKREYYRFSPRAKYWLFAERSNGKTRHRYRELLRRAIMCSKVVEIPYAVRFITPYQVGKITCKEVNNNV